VEHRNVSRTEAPTARLPEAAGTAVTRVLRDAREQPLVLERYRLCEQLGAGAFGVVWRAHDERLERDVAVKAIAGEHVASGRAEREARAAARLAHPAIVTLYEAGSDGETTYLVSELVRGATLAELLAEGALSDRDVAEIGLALCQALAHAHAHGVVHRDVKPSNLLVPEVAHAGAPAAKLTDFGVARVLVGTGEDLLTRTGDVVGTLAYMAPEQLRGTVADLHRALKAALPLLGDEPGTVAAPHVERAATAVTRVAEVGRHSWRRRSREQELADVAAELGQAPPHDDPTAVHGSRPARRLPAPLVAGHVVPGLAAGGLAALAVSALGTASSVQPRPLLAGALAAAAVGLLPRIGWIAAAAVLIGWIAGEVGQTGTALLVACGVVASPLLLPLRGRAWSLPFAAPLLGTIMLAGAYPALAGQARTLWRRAALGAVGFWVLALAEPVAHATLLYGSVRGTAAHAVWADSPQHAVSDVLGPLVRSGALACAALWAAGAAVLPWLVRGRSAALDLVAATLWAAGLAAGAGAIGQTLHGAVPQPDARGAVLGAAAGVLLAVGARAVRRPPARRRDPAPGPLA
jgi:hypothetical protein